MSSERGNVLFLILIAVALFAALSFAVTRTLNNTAQQSPERDTQRISGAALIQYGTSVARTVMAMKMRGVNAEEFCFDSPSWGNNNYNHAACSVERNKVFSTHPDGGNVVWLPAPKGANSGEPWYISGQTCFIDVDQNCNGNGIDDEDIVMFLPGIPRAICIELNKKLAVPNPNGEPPKAAGSLWPAAMPAFNGTFSDGGRIDSGGNGDLAILAGHLLGCVEGNGNPPAGTYTYFHVLLRR